MPGSPKTCDVVTLAQHFLHDGWQSAKEPVDVRFTEPAGSGISPFSVGYVLGFSRSMAALCILETCVRIPLSIEEMAQVSKELLSLRAISATYTPLADLGTAVIRTIAVKMRGSERQRPDPLQLAEAFLKAVEARIAAGATKPKAQLIDEVMQQYNSTQVVTNCRVDGDEKQAVRFMIGCPPSAWATVRGIWNDFRVRESPLTANILASPWLKVPMRDIKAQLNPKWFAIMTPTPEKYEAWLRRVCVAFRLRVERAQSTGKAPSLRTRAVPLPCFHLGQVQE